MIPAAPGRLSTTTCCFQLSASFCEIRRVETSGVLPGVKPTTMRIGLLGKASTDEDAPSTEKGVENMPHAAATRQDVANEEKSVAQELARNCFFSMRVSSFFTVIC